MRSFATLCLLGLTTAVRLSECEREHRETRRSTQQCMDNMNEDQINIIGDAFEAAIIEHGMGLADARAQRDRLTEAARNNVDVAEIEREVREVAGEHGLASEDIEAGVGALEQGVRNLGCGSGSESGSESGSGHGSRSGCGSGCGSEGEGTGPSEAGAGPRGQNLAQMQDISVEPEDVANKVDKINATLKLNLDETCKDSKEAAKACAEKVRAACSAAGSSDEDANDLCEELASLKEGAKKEMKDGKKGKKDGKRAKKDGKRAKKDGEETGDGETSSDKQEGKGKKGEGKGKKN